MDWLSLAGRAISRIPLERLLTAPRDNPESLRELQHMLEGNQGSGEPAPPLPSGAAAQTAEGPSGIDRPEAPGKHPAIPPSDGVSLEETVIYQNREIGKLLLRMDRHYAQKLRINGVPCDCGASKHLLDLESLCEETVSLVDDSRVYYRIMDWIREVGPRSTDAAAKSGLYDEEYPAFSYQARDFRKEIIGSLDPNDLFVRRPGEPEGDRLLPVVSEEEKAEIREKAHQKIEEALA